MGIVIFLSPNFKEVAAGIAILLFGMIMLEKGFSAFVKGPLKNLIQRGTDKLYKSLGLGFIVTSLVQSSSLISVIAISFVSAGMIGLYQGIGIIFGANIGTTATAWLVYFFGLNINVSVLAMPLLTFGIILVFQKSTALKGVGHVIGGLGFFFLGIYFIKEGFELYKYDVNLVDFAMPGFWGLIVYTLIGIAITALLQSSSAAMAIILTALAVGQITYHNSLALTIGANIGTTVTAMLGAIGTHAAGKRLAGAHVIFNLTTGVLALILIIPLSKFVDLLSSSVGFDPGNYTIKLAIFHSIFNILGVAVMVPTMHRLVRFLNKIFVEKPVDVTGISYPVYLNEGILAYPHTAIRSLLDETKHLFETAVFKIVAHGLNLHRDDIVGTKKLKEIVSESKETLGDDIEALYYNKVKVIYSKIVKYASLAQSKFSLSPEGMEAFTRIKLANRNVVETIKDIRGLRKNVSAYMTSNNKHIQHEYDRLRRKVSRVLREIHLTQMDEVPEAHLERLEKLKSKADQSDVLIDGTLDHLIRRRKISSEMATSLANDSQNVARICKRLIETAELLYIERDTLIHSASDATDLPEV
ncbi:MAG: Na/Pi cotransporter family protein [Bacteroidetes bacterium]|nr:MAG: Na/Pi cotransporter family protein [Bacteroidota bacterium]